MKLSLLKSIMLGSAFSLCCPAANTGDDGSVSPLKVYILAGQSNMTGMVNNQTLEHIRMFPDTAKEFAALFDEDGNPVMLDDVYVCQWMDKDGGKLAPRYGGGNGNMFGPEYPFGIYMHEARQEPFLIIKNSLGGRSLDYNFRSPSAGEWTPPAGHPDLEEEEKETLPIPEKLDLPADEVSSENLIPETASRNTGKYMGLSGMRGVKLDEVNGIHPICLTFRAGKEEKVPGQVFQSGDLIIGVDGSGLGEDAIEQWREAFYGSKSSDGDWMITVTRWREGKIETFDFDIADTLKGGREALPAYLAEQKEKASENPKRIQGYYYDLMIEHVQTVLQDIKTYHPGYDEKAGYEIAGFVWFQGYNDLVNGGAYPNRDKPRGYEKYTWLLEHFIRDVRKDLHAPELPFVIGVLGVGGDEEPPSSNLGYFQQAQAAVAKNPEFQETVANVRTGKYWDQELGALIANSGSSQRLRSGDWAKVKGPDGKPVWHEKPSYEDYRSYVLKRAQSNQGYHYFGSAKIMSGIGKGFAEAMIQLQDNAGEK